MTQTPEQHVRSQAKYQSSAKEKKKRAARGRARYKLMKAGKVRVGDGKDVDHKNGNPLDNRMSNLTVKSKSKNRSYKRTKSGGKKNPRD